jgi:hypothetical protein
MLPKPSTVLFIFSTFQPMSVFNPMKQSITHLAKTYADSFTNIQQSQLHSELSALQMALHCHILQQWINTIPLLGAHDTTFVASNVHILSIVSRFHMLFNAFLLDGVLSVKSKVLVSIHED